MDRVVKAALFATFWSTVIGLGLYAAAMRTIGAETAFYVSSALGSAILIIGFLVAYHALNLEAFAYECAPEPTQAERLRELKSAYPVKHTFGRFKDNGVWDECGWKRDSGERKTDPPIEEEGGK